ncbi:lipopolysaccharide biosynthesis protein [Pseudomonas sp. FP2300]|uniref:lipopolysaccharide biosynthesis protein n=1 Tax=Pseudomonas sp. FP2300 TaxID=2954090 RepID=UPI002734B702|nr:lipopolysaccharide biosynthesis protein [Pseudomonas sp. FP2300]WLH64108.1 lipopolysaccharide biosynthesis protein [Pseudomonas sp. FP2300]
MSKETSDRSYTKDPPAAPSRQISPDELKSVKSGPVFIIASGNSAKHFPIHEFSDIPMITMNGAISMFTHTDIKPFFYVCSDNDFPRQQPELFATAMRLSEHVALWEDQFEAIETPPSGRSLSLKKAPRASFLATLFGREKSLVRKTSFLSKRSKDIGFSKDLAAGCFDARTVMYLALQVAYHLGFNKVFLVGFDLNQAAGRFYETAQINRSPCGLDQHYYTRILPSLKLMANSVIDSRFQVYNLSSTSRVPTHIIPKVSVDDAKRILAT